jgi:predicted RNA-binding Zn-ribbon protein involved in translation (DUF1610 family)
MLKNCTTCGAQTKEYAEFPSPYNPGEKIVRCRDCRKISRPYKDSTGKEGP